MAKTHGAWLPNRVALPPSLADASQTGGALRNEGLSRGRGHQRCTRDRQQSFDRVENGRVGMKPPRDETPYPLESGIIVEDEHWDPFVIGATSAGSRMVRSNKAIPSIADRLGLVSLYPFKCGSLIRRCRKTAGRFAEFCEAPLQLSRLRAQNSPSMQVGHKQQEHPNSPNSEGPKVKGGAAGAAS